MPFLAPVVGAIASAATAIGGFIGAMGIFGQIAVGIGLNLVGAALQKKRQRRDNSNLGGTNLNISYGGAQGRQIGVGLFATAGHEMFAAAFGEANKIFVRVVQLSDFTIDSVSRVLIDGEWCNLTGNNNSLQGHTITGKHSDFIRIKIYKGTSGQTGDSYLQAQSGGRWTAKHKGAGLSYAIIYVTYDQKDMNSLPQFLFECKGVCYDPRKDSTVGGNGGQRWNNPNTWGYSDNPIVLAYNYARGFYRNGELIIGKGMPAGDLPLGGWIQAMNVCDEIEGNNKRYRAGMIFHSGDGVQHRDNLEPLLNACAGALVERVDGDVPLVGITQAVVATLSHDDLIVDASHSYRPKRPRSELVNAVHGTYNDPEKSWEAVAYPAQTDAAALTADGERHATQIDFRAVFDGPQAARLGLSALRENRYQKMRTITVRPRWIVLEVGDWIDFDDALYGKTRYRVIARSLAPLGENGACNVTLTLQEVGAGMYDETVIIPEMPVNAPAPQPIYQSFPDGFTVTPAQVTSQDGGRKIPVFDALWLLPTDVTVVGVKIEYWQTDVPDKKLETVVASDKTAVRLSGFAPDTAYTFRATFITEPRRTTFWSALTTLVAAAEEFIVDREQILDNLAEFNAWASTKLRSVQEMDDFYGLISAEAIAAGYLTTQNLKRELSVSLGATRAEYSEMIDVAASETKAVANKVETLKAQVNNNIASAINQMQTSINTVDGKVNANSVALTSLQNQVNNDIATAVNALNTSINVIDGKTVANATAITGLQTQVNNVSSSVTMKAESFASPGDNWARWGVQVKTGSGNSWSTGALYIDTKAASSRVVIQANQFQLTNGSLTTAPLVFANGVLRLNAADIGTVTAGSINILNKFKVSSLGEVEIKSGNTLQRLVISNSKIEVYDSANKLRVRLGIW